MILIHLNFATFLNHKYIWNKNIFCLSLKKIQKPNPLNNNRKNKNPLIKLNLKMEDENLYDEFGNYIGPEILDNVPPSP